MQNYGIPKLEIPRSALTVGLIVTVIGRNNKTAFSEKSFSLLLDVGQTISAYTYEQLIVLGYGDNINAVTFLISSLLLCIDRKTMLTVILTK